jgi:hypothetical protein
MKKIIEYFKTLTAAYAMVAFGILFPAITYPLTSLSQFSFLKQLAFAKNGVFYEPSITDHALNIFGIVKVPFGIILATSIIILLVGAVRLFYIKKIT